ncbi:MAG: ABC transporter [Rhodobacteraceae bacterium]|nr:MAG: ABC transporter [Paracoccaceae bacterium]
MSGLLALLDDVAGIAKVAAASVDDVVTQAAKAGAKAAGAVIDDAAVTPKYVQGFAASRELPIIWKITKGSFKNKLLYLLPAGMLLSSFAPWMIAPLLMLGGGYLCFEGAEKIWQMIVPHAPPPEAQTQKSGDSAYLEEQKAAGAIKTDFILSAEIMTIALAAIPPSNIWMEAATLAIVAIGITVVVYGSVALIVKADDVGLLMCRKGRFGVTRGVGRAIVRAMPGFLVLLTNIGTAAMLWVGGSIVIHGAEVLGFGAMGHYIQGLSEGARDLVPAQFQDAVGWTVKAALDGVFGLALGLVLIPVVVKVIAPVWGALRGQKGSGTASQ